MYRYFTSVNFFKCPGGHMVISKPLTGLIFSCLVYRRAYCHQQTTYQSYIFLFSVQTVIWSLVDYSPVLYFLVQCTDGHMVISRPLISLTFSCLVFRRAYGHQQTTHRPSFSISQGIIQLVFFPYKITNIFVQPFFSLLNK